MNYLQRPQVPQDDPNSSLFTSMANTMNQNSMGMGGNVGQYGSSAGSTMTIPLSQLPNRMNYVGVYNENTAYNINDVVFVDPNMGTYSASFYGSSSYGSASLCPGLFVALRAVPPITQDSSYFLSTVATAYASAGVPLTSMVANAYQWIEYNVYYPIYPPIPTSYISNVTDGSGYKITCNLQYWAPLMPMINVSICSNNVILNSWIGGCVSGSFNSSNLPHH